MPLTLNPAGSPTFQETVTVPQAGEARTAVSVRDAPQKLLTSTKSLQNRLLELQARTPWAATGGVLIPGYPRALLDPTVLSWNYLYGKDETTASTVPTLQQTTAAPAEVPIEVPGLSSVGRPLGTSGTAEMIEVGIVVIGQDHAGLPGTMPRLRLFIIAPGYAAPGTTRWPAPALVASQDDTSASLAAYEQAHVIALTGLSIATHDEDRWFLNVRGESGTNAGAGKFQIGWVYAVYRSSNGTFP
jgi:hypothetical protein